mmetsp:Transcript_9523/g.23320  ORF Transcript_9523/g.23320 Transcript_9523/m.23320 type:complete len:251 (+) Transcript_9523:855-1607(+)
MTGPPRDWLRVDPRAPRMDPVTPLGERRGPGPPPSEPRAPRRDDSRIIRRPTLSNVSMSSGSSLSASCASSRVLRLSRMGASSPSGGGGGAASSSLSLSADTKRAPISVLTRPATLVICARRCSLALILAMSSSVGAAFGAGGGLVGDGISSSSSSSSSSSMICTCRVPFFCSLGDSGAFFAAAGDVLLFLRSRTKACHFLETLRIVDFLLILARISSFLFCSRSSCFCSCSCCFCNSRRSLINASIFCC